MAAEKQVNYTPEMVERIKAMYADNVDTAEIAAAIGRTKRSVISKLVREGVYVAAEKPVAAARDEGPTKKELLNALRPLVAFDVDGLTGATKDAIASVLALAEQNSEDSESDESESVAAD